MTQIVSEEELLRNTVDVNVDRSNVWSEDTGLVGHSKNILTK